MASMGKSWKKRGVLRVEGKREKLVAGKGFVEKDGDRGRADKGRGGKGHAA